MSSDGRSKRRIPLRLPRLEQLLPIACLASAAVLFASELMVTFEFTPPGGEPLAEQTAADQHGYGLAVVAGLGFVATLVAVLAASKPAAIGVGAAGTVALLTFLIVDLPDAGAVGTLGDATQSFFDAEAVPRAGFWLELIGALGLAVSGVALATLTPEQLAALRPRRPEWLQAAGANPGGGEDDHPAPRGSDAESRSPRPKQAERRGD